jgi:hypothetical protein
MSEEIITITFKGNKKFKQALVDRIYDLLTDDDFLAECSKPGCGLNFESTICPSEERGDEG